MITPTQYTPAIANEQRPENGNMLKKLTKIDTRVYTTYIVKKKEEEKHKNIKYKRKKQKIRQTGNNRTINPSPIHSSPCLDTIA